MSFSETFSAVITLISHHHSFKSSFDICSGCCFRSVFYTPSWHQHRKLFISCCECKWVFLCTDRAHGNEFSTQFEESCLRLEEAVRGLEKTNGEQKDLMAQLHTSEYFYDQQYREARIVANVSTPCFCPASFGITPSCFSCCINNLLSVVVFLNKSRIKSPGGYFCDGRWWSLHHHVLPPITSTWLPFFVFSLCIICFRS